MVMQATSIGFPHQSLSSPPPHITSLLFEPYSLSLALLHSDSSFSLYPSFSPFSLSSLLPTPQNLIPPPSSSSTFLLLRRNPNSNPRVLFLVSGPYRGGSQILLRFYILQTNSNSFTRAQVVCTQRDLQFHHNLGVLVNVNHGVSVKLSGENNFFTMYSISSSKIWVFAVKMLSENTDDDNVSLKLMRCSTIECCEPVWSINVSFDLLILGEDNGVRVFNLSSLLKSRVRTIAAKCDDTIGRDAESELTCNGGLGAETDENCASVDQRSTRSKLYSGEIGACFVAFNINKVEGSELVPVRAISIQAQSPMKYVILDSTGSLHLLCITNPFTGLASSYHMKQFPPIMKVQKLAVSPGTQTLWISDGNHSLHMVTVANIESAFSENNRNEGEEKQIQASVIQAIFSSERIQDVIPLSANAVLLLGQGNIYAYANS